MKRAANLIKSRYEELALRGPCDRFLERGLDAAFADMQVGAAALVPTSGGWATDRLRIHESAVDWVCAASATRIDQSIGGDGQRTTSGVPDDAPRFRPAMASALS